MQVIPDGIPGFSDYPSAALPIALLLPFLISFLALHFVLFKPLLRWLEQRDAATAGARAEAAALEAQVTERLGQLEERLDGARSASREIRAAARTRALEEEQALLGQARAQAERRIVAALASLEDERSAASQGLRGTVDALAGEIAAKVLGREIGA
jgi:F-type H+-transporting ATPase subunit b